jgi:hypothetical protein
LASIETPDLAEASFETETPVPGTGAHKLLRKSGYFTAASLVLKRDFFRLAVAKWITPVLAALSYPDIAARKAVAASSRLPAFTVSKKFFSSVFKRDFTDLFCVCFRALLRIRFSADFVFGIVKIP